MVDCMQLLVHHQPPADSQQWGPTHLGFGISGFWATVGTRSLAASRIYFTASVFSSIKQGQQSNRTSVYVISGQWLRSCCILYMGRAIYKETP